MRIPLGIISAALLISISASAQQYTISTVAGGTPPPNSSNAQSVALGGLAGVASDQSGNIYFIASDSVFMNQNGALVRIAGNARIGYSGDNGAATSAQLNNPAGIALDNAGNLYISDSANNRIRKVVLSSGQITTIAGTGTASYTGDNGPATAATLNNPQGLAVDVAGNLYIADTNNNVIRKIVMSTGTITTVAGTGVQGIGGDGQLATSNGVRLNNPAGVAVDNFFNIFIADSGNHRIREVPQSGNPLTPGFINTIAGIGVPGFAGDLGAAITAQLNDPTGIAVDTAGNLYVLDYNNNRVRKIANSTINTVASASSGLRTPVAIAVDPNANLYIADSGQAMVLRYTAPVGTSSSITPIAGNGGNYYIGDSGPAISAQLLLPQGLAVDINGIYIADRGAMRVRKIASNNISTITNTVGMGAAGVAVDAAGNFYIADAVNNRILKVDSNGVVTLIAGTGVPGSFGDNGPAQLAQLNQPGAIAVDASGSVYVADTGNNRIRKITFFSGSSTGTISTLAGNGTATFSGENVPAVNAQVNAPTGIALDASGNIYIADTGNNRIRKISTAGIITTVAGNGTAVFSGDSGPATSAGLVSPHGVALDTKGSLYITCYGAARVRKVSNGTIITIAGNGTMGYSGDGGPALSAQLSQPWGITVDGSGYVYVSDVGEQAVRLLSPQAASVPVIQTTTLLTGTVGTPYAQSLTATGGTQPYTWSVVSGTLPPGLTFSPSGSITGTPTVAGSYLIQVQVTDSFLVTSQPVIIAVNVNPSAPGGLGITTAPVLVPGLVGTPYSVQLNATLGTPPYNWVLISGALPAGLSLFPSGAIVGTPTTAGNATFSVRLNDNTGAATTQTFSINVLSPGTLTRTGSLGHIAAGGTWSTRVYLTNLSNSPLAVSLVIHDDSGNLLTIPINVTQQGSVGLVNTNTFNGAMNANSTLIMDMGSQLPNTITGWIDVLSSGNQGSLAGFAIFRTVSSTVTSEGTTALQTTFGSKLIIPFDNTGNFVTAYAISNLAASATTVNMTVLDVSGNQLGSCSLNLPANGHHSDLIPNTCAVSTGQQGIAQFTSTSGSLAGVGLRASTTSGTFTSVPSIQQ